MSIAAQISAALDQLIEPGDHNLAESGTYEPRDDAVITDVGLLVHRGGLPRPVILMGQEAQEFTAQIMVRTSEVSYYAIGDRIRIVRADGGTELWHVDGVAMEIPGARTYNCTRRQYRPAISEA